MTPLKHCLNWGSLAGLLAVVRVMSWSAGQLLIQRRKPGGQPRPLCGARAAPEGRMLEQTREFRVASHGMTAIR